MTMLSMRDIIMTFGVRDVWAKTGQII